MHYKQHRRLLGMVLHKLRAAVFNKRIQEHRADIADCREVALFEFVGDLIILVHFGACRIESFLHIFKYRIIHEAVSRVGFPAAGEADLAAVRDICSASWAFVHTSHLSMYGAAAPVTVILLLSLI